jgi:alpha-N-arabinofuranosidase
MDAHNTFDSPNDVRPVPFAASRERDALLVEIPPKAVIVVAVDE